MTTNAASNAVSTQDVFIGGDVDLSALTNSSNISTLLATGRVGFYSQDGGIEAAFENGSLPAIAGAMANTGPGEAEVNIQSAQSTLAWFQSWWQYCWVDNGLAPNSINAIIDYTSPTWQTDFAAMVTAAHSYGVTTIAPIFAPNLGTDSLQDFATSADYSALRAAAMLGGGLTVDSPPEYFFARGQAYENFIYGEIQWAHQNGLRATVIISPNYDDADFLADTQAFVKMLAWNNATPSEWVVENYTPDDPNGIGSETATNSIANVALWVAQNAATSNSVPTTPPPTPSISVSLPASSQEAAYGAGVTITVTFTTTYLAGPVYWGVMTAQGWVETPQFYAASLDANGNATISAHLAHTGDYIAVATSLTNPALLVNSAPVTITEPSFSITPAALGTVQEAAYGAGVTVTETIATRNIAGPIYWGVMTAQGWVETPQFYAASLDVNGNATITAHLAHTGDYIAVATSLTNPALLVDSAPITITEPAFSITPAALGSVQEAAYGAGVTVTETITTRNIAGPIYWGVMTAQGWVETPQFYAASLDANGNATITAHLAHTGDYIAVATSLTNPALLVNSAPITITEPAFSITPAALGTVQEAAYGAGVTVTETIATRNIAGPIYWGVMTAQGWVETPQFYAASLDVNGNATITAHLAHTGDYIAVATSLTNPALLVNSAPVTITEPSFSITPAALGTVQEAAYGAGVTVTETIATRNIAGPIYWGVMTAQGWVETPQFYAASLDANGNATITAHLAHTGDYIAVATSLTNPALLVNSAPVTITEPSFSITPAALGTVQEAAYGAGVTVTETIATRNIAGPIYWGVMTAQGWVETPQFYAASLDANGNATITAHLAHTGDYIAVATSLTNPALLVDSAPVTITEPSFSITPAALGTVQEAAYGAGVTVTETIATRNIAGPIYWGVMTAQGWVETPQFYAASLDANGNATISAHLAHTGDYIAVATSLTNSALLVNSAPITITEPSFSITPAALGTVQEAAYGAGVTVTETIATRNIAGPIYWGVMTAQGWVETPQFYAASLDVNGNATITAHLAHTGDYIAVATSLTNPALLVDSAPVTITEPSFSITPAALGTVQEAAYGAGVTVTETIATRNIAGPIYWGVMTAQGWVETPQFYAASLDANGNATITAHLAHTGDYIAVATSLTNPALLVNSAPVTITEPSFSITPAALGTVQEAAYGAGVTVTETIATRNIAGPIYWGVMTAQGWVETPQFYAASLDANGNATITAHLAHTGDYIAVATSLTNPALLVDSAPVTITEPSFSITPAALGTVQEAAYGAGVTVTETIATRNIAGPIYWGVMTAQGWVETPQFYAASLDANGNATISAHLAHTGDYIAVATSLTNSALLVNSAPITITEPSFSITPAALGTVQEAAYGAGVTVTETIATRNIAGPIYWGVMTAQGWVETPQFYAASLDVNGNATITAHLAHTGDYIAVATSLTNPALLVDSAPVTITEPSFSITPAALGTVQEAAYGAGVTVTETIATRNIAGPIYWGVMTAQGWVETPQFYAASLDANGNATITAHLAHTGDYIAVATSLINPALLVNSAPITITEPSFSITPAALGTVQEAAYGAGVTVTETITTRNIAGPIYWGVMTAQGWVETPQFYAASLDANGNATISAHLAHTGDYIAVATSLTNSALLVNSAPITITEPSFSITPAALGTVQEAAYGAGVTVTETIATRNIAGPVYWGVMTAQGWVETPQFYAASLDANGNATITAQLNHTGDYIAVATSLTNPALLVDSAPITIIEAPPLVANGVGTTLVEGDGNFSVTGNASDSSLTLGVGDQIVSLTGTANTVTTGAGNSVISVGAGATVHAAGGLSDTTTITANGGGSLLDVRAGMAFLNTAGSVGNTFMLNAKDQGLTTINGFNMSGTDTLDLARTVDGLNIAGDLSNLGSFVTAASAGGATTLYVDPTGGNATPTAFAVLNNTTATLGQLIAGHHVSLV